MEKQPWITFFSQTGAEICDIAEAVGRWPDKIITNTRPEHLRVIDSRIPKKLLFYVKNKPTSEEYLWHLTKFESKPIVTLHGWLRVAPPDVCETFQIYNGHPGLITKYPELKGKDPQIKAYKAGHDTIGVVLHKVTAGVDEGPIESWSEISVNDLSIDETFTVLRDMSLRMWTELLKRIV